MKGEIPAPKVTVQPNFEVHVESLFYPEGILSRLRPLSDILTEDNVTILKLNKQKVAARLAEDEKLDVIALLTELTGGKLPQNIVMELEEWTGHSENFILFEGFGLWEGDRDRHVSDSFTVEEISSNLRIVRSPETLFERLEKAESVPIRIRHKNASLEIMPEKATTVFLKISTLAAKPKKKHAIALMRQTMIILHFPDSTSLKRYHKAFLDVRCPVQVDKSNLTLAYDAGYEAEAAAVLERLKKDYTIKIEDVAE